VESVDPGAWDERPDWVKRVEERVEKLVTARLGREPVQDLFPQVQSRLAEAPVS
jgi:hypothetical protein